jgi:hypothetical protein
MPDHLQAQRGVCQCCFQRTYQAAVPDGLIMAVSLHSCAIRVFCGVFLQICWYTKAASRLRWFGAAAQCQFGGAGSFKVSRVTSHRLGPATNTCTFWTRYLVLQLVCCDPALQGGQVAQAVMLGHGRLSKHAMPMCCLLSQQQPNRPP